MWSFNYFNFLYGGVWPNLGAPPLKVDIFNIIKVNNMHYLNRFLCITFLSRSWPRMNVMFGQIWVLSVVNHFWVPLFSILCHAMACFCVISYIQISIGYYPCVHYFVWILSLWALLLSSIIHYDITMGNAVARDAHCNITVGNDVARGVHC